MSKKILVFLLALFIISASGTVFASEETKKVNNYKDEFTYTDFEFRSNGWNWKDVGYGQKDPTGSGNCKLQVPGHQIFVIGNPVTKSGSDNEWTLDATKFKLPSEKDKAVEVGLFYQLSFTSKDKNGKDKTDTKSYLVNFMFTKKVSTVLNLNSFMKDLHKDPSAKINSVALGPGKVVEKTKISIYRFEKEVPIYKWQKEMKWRLVDDPDKPIYKWQKVMVAKIVPDYENPIITPTWVDDTSKPKFDYKQQPVTVTNQDSLNQLGSSLTYAVLNIDKLYTGITLDFVKDNSGTKYAEVFAIFNDDGQIEITFVNKDKKDFYFGHQGTGAKAYTVLPPASGNKVGDQTFDDDEFKNTRKLVINCPAADESGNVYLYIFAHIMIGDFTGYEKMPGDPIITYPDKTIYVWNGKMEKTDIIIGYKKMWEEYWTGNWEKIQIGTKTLVSYEEKDGWEKIFVEDLYIDLDDLANELSKFPQYAAQILKFLEKLA